MGRGWVEGFYVQHTRNTKGALDSHSRPGDGGGGWGILLVSQLKEMCSGLWKIGTRSSSYFLGLQEDQGFETN